MWVADGQREIGKLSPNALSQTAVLSLAAGALQSIPASWDLLVRAVRNVNGPTIRSTSDTQVRRRTAQLQLQQGAMQRIPTHWESMLSLGGPTKFPRKVDGSILSAAFPSWAEARPRLNKVDEYIYDPQVDARVFYVSPPAAPGSTINAAGILSFDAWYSDAGNVATIVEECFYRPMDDTRSFYVNPGVAAGTMIEAVGKVIVNDPTSLSDAIIVPINMVPALSLYVAHRAMQKQVDYASGGISNALYQEFVAGVRASGIGMSPSVPTQQPSQEG